MAICHNLLKFALLISISTVSTDQYVVPDIISVVLEVKLQLSQYSQLNGSC